MSYKRRREKREEKEKASDPPSENQSNLEYSGVRGKKRSVPSKEGED